MCFFKKHSANERPGQDRMARLMAARIIGWQRRIADRLNGRARRYAKGAQLRWFWLCCLLASAAIICSMLITGRKSALPRLPSSIMPVHIGQSSGGLPKKPLPSTDSLTHKK